MVKHSKPTAVMTVTSTDQVCNYVLESEYVLCGATFSGLPVAAIMLVYM